MRNLLNPKWIFIINTLPVIILFALLYNDYSVIKSLLSAKAVSMWFNYAVALGILAAMNLAYAVFLIIKRKQVEWIYSIVGLVLNIIFLVSYYMNLERMMSFSVPSWMVSEGYHTYAGTFLMPTFMYFLFVLVIYSTRENKAKVWKSFVAAVAIPLCFYLLSLVVMPLRMFGSSRIMEHVLIVFVVSALTAFLFFLAKAVYIISMKKGSFSYKYQLTWRILVSIIFPVAGLMLNAGIFAGLFSGAFGDFSNHWFYILAVVNGIFICLPAFERTKYRLPLFACRCVTFSYTLYFFIVFLPYLPFSVFAILAAGLGFLMLTPFALFITHVNILSDDFLFLNRKFSKKLLVTIMILGVITIPIIIHFNFIRGKNALNQTLNYMYNPDYSKKYSIDKSALSNALQEIKKHKNTNSRNFIGRGSGASQTPYLSTYYNWLVLDNLTLSNAKINEIERVFWGRVHEKIIPLVKLNDKVAISKISSDSKYDAEKGSWTSWVNLEITSKNNVNRSSEYVTTINLPDGCWISDYYLYVWERKEMGLLAEKRAAMWIYSQIRTVNRDPGILYYLAGNKVAFRVFPFSYKETRRTGIEFIHKEPVTLKFDNNVVRLGNDKNKSQNKIETSDVIFISATEKQNLPKIQRTPYYHFIVDTSRNAKKYKKKFIQRIEKLLSRKTIDNNSASISFVNSFVSTTPMNGDWKQQFTSQSNDGGFYLDRAIKTILFKAYKSKSNSYPVMVVVTRDMSDAVLEKVFTDFKISFPESDFFYSLGANGALKFHSLISSPKKEFKGNVGDKFTNKVYAYPNDSSPIAYLPADNKSSIILKKDIFNTDAKNIKTKDWISGLTMQGKWISQTLHPEATSREWLNLVKFSFMSGIMTPVTSYLVVENEAQKAALKRKQEQILSSNNTLDVNDEVIRMSEPGLCILLLIFGGFIFLMKIRTLIKTQ